LDHLVLSAGMLPVTRWIADFIQWVQGFGALGTIIFGAFYVAGVVLFFPGILLTTAAGALYGVVIGTLIVSPASVLGATLAFVIARYFARDWVHRKLEQHPTFGAIDRAIGKKGFRVILLLRLQPLLPFNLLNYALGLTGVSLRDYVIASFIGMFPATVLYVYLGSIVQNLTELLHGHLPASGLRNVLFWIGLAATIVLVWYIGRIARKALKEELERSAA
jgi:uncharacterized membrane protein YdjX (TVP38/TMEM64 family)